MYVDVKSCFEDLKTDAPSLPLFGSESAATFFSKLRRGAFREHSHGIDGIGDSRAGRPAPGSGGLRWGHDPGA